MNMQIMKEMKKLIIFGYGFQGVACFKAFKNSEEYCFIGFADNNRDKQGNIACGFPIRSFEEVVQESVDQTISVIIAANAWNEIALQFEKSNGNVNIEGIWQNGRLRPYSCPMTFEKLDFSKPVKLYAGDICDEVHMEDKNLYGLSLHRQDEKHIRFDITEKYPLPDCCIDHYQAEDVLEHIALDWVVPAINEIYRILKKGALFRVCLPDYFSPIKKEFSMKSVRGEILFDPSGGGDYREGNVVNGGHVWFPNYLMVRELLDKTKFRDVRFLCYYTEQEEFVCNGVDMSLGYVTRYNLENADGNYSLVVDCYK